MIHDARQQYENAARNAKGHCFESYIKAACTIYAERGRAQIDKTPEPFRVLEKNKNGIFKGRFTAHAQPDFQGTLSGGRSIVFEAKYTDKDRLKRNALTENQQKSARASFKMWRDYGSMCRNRKRIFLCTVGDMAGHEG